MKKAIIPLLVFLLLVITRFYNLDHTARFIWDESSDLVKMHQYFVEKKISLIGPISEEGNKVFSSLIYYLLLPFAVIGKFDPVSTAYGAAFWGVITSLLTILLIKKKNPKLLPYAVFLALCWSPLVITGRWAWNPNLIPLWIILSLLFFISRPVPLFLSGLFLGLSFHQHYLALFSIIPYAFIVSLKFIKQKNYLYLLSFSSGLILAFLPFVLFDITHPPGLFLTRVLFFNNTHTSLNLLTFLFTFFDSIKIFFTYISANLIVPAIIVFTLSLLLFTLDLRRHRLHITYLLPCLLQIICLVFIKNIYDYYFLPSLIFFLLWLIVPRINFGSIIAKVILIIIIISSLINLPHLLTHQDWSSDISSTRKITNIIATDISKFSTLKNNIAVLASPDPNTYGRRYRDLLLIKNIRLEPKENYSNLSILYVVSTSSPGLLISNNEAEINTFNGKMTRSWSVKDSDWKIYRFEK